MMPGSLAGKLALLLALCALAFPAMAQPEQPTTNTVPGKCEWQWKQNGGIGVWAERCALDTGVWELNYREDLLGFELTVDGKDGMTVLQLFARSAGSDIAALLPELRKRGYIPDDDECVFAPAAIKGPRTLAFVEIVPTGKRKADFEATPSDEVPEPPCGEYGASTHGIRYFVTDIRHPTKVVYVNLGQDGTMFDPNTITLE